VKEKYFSFYIYKFNPHTFGSFGTYPASVKEREETSIASLLRIVWKKERLSFCPQKQKQMEDDERNPLFLSIINTLLLQPLS
jgi:hypothetical protein